MATVMLKLPMTATLLATLLLSSDGLSVVPLVIVAVVTAYVASAWLPEAPSDLRFGHRKTTGPEPAAGDGDGDPSGAPSHG
jgi:hypothetical protein